MICCGCSSALDRCSLGLPSIRQSVPWTGAMSFNLLKYSPNGARHIVASPSVSQPASHQTIHPPFVYTMFILEWMRCIQKCSMAFSFRIIDVCRISFSNFSSNRNGNEGYFELILFKQIRNISHVSRCGMFSFVFLNCIEHKLLFRGNPPLTWVAKCLCGVWNM